MQSENYDCKGYNNTHQRKLRKIIKERQIKSTKEKQGMSNKNSNKRGLCEMTSGLSRLTEESHRYTKFQGLGVALLTWSCSFQGGTVVFTWLDALPSQLEKAGKPCGGSNLEAWVGF